MKEIIILTILSLSSLAQADDGVSTAVKACQQSDIEFCQTMKKIKKNVEERAKYVIKYIGMEKPLVVGAFVVQPEISHRFGDHRIKITPKQISYSFEF